METIWMRFHLKAAILGPNLQKMMHQMGKVFVRRSLGMVVGT